MKQRYQALDGLRGVAALCVLAGHVTDPVGLTWVVPHSYLAVDFFFMLSGFVIAEAYEQRLRDGLGVWAFLWIRARRLWPMIALGTLLGFVVALAKWKLTGAPQLWAIDTALLLGLLLVPTALPFDNSPAFPLNMPAWSLFYEVAANAVYALLSRFSSVITLSLLIIAGGVLLCLTGAAAGTVGGGPTLDDWPAGLARVTFGFSVGLLLHRVRPHVKLPLPLLVIILLAAAALPTIRGAWVIELGLVLLVFPLVIAAGAHAGGGRWSLLAGRLSYPLYAVHAPLIQVFSNQARSHHLHGATLGLFLVAEAAAALLLAYLADRFVDVPARAFLARLGMRPVIVQKV